MSGQGANAREATLALLAARQPGGTVCPSEVARTLAKGGGDAADWRTMMPIVHAAVDDLASEDRVRLSWKGQPMAARSGPYRIGRPGSE